MGSERALSFPLGRSTTAKRTGTLPNSLVYRKTKRSYSRWLLLDKTTPGVISTIRAGGPFPRRNRPEGDGTGCERPGENPPTPAQYNPSRKKQAENIFLPHSER